MSEGLTSDFMNIQCITEASNPNLNKGPKTIIENISEDITISKCENVTVSETPASNAVALTTQVLPLVYISNKKQAVPFAMNAGNKLNSNIILSTVASNTSTKPNTSVATINLNKSQNVVIAGRGRPLMLPKQPVTLVQQGTKGTYVTMLKTTSEVQIALQTDKLNVTKTGDGVVMPLQKSNVNPAKKFVLTTPLPKVPGNSGLATKMQSKPSITATTNALQPGQFTLLPMPVPQNDNLSSVNHVTSFQIRDGKFVSKVPAAVTIMRENRNFPVTTESGSQPFNGELGEGQPGLEKNDISSKSYELSIADEESLSNQSDSKLVVSSADSNSSEESLSNDKSNNLRNVSILKKNLSSNIVVGDNNNDLVKSENDVNTAQSRIDTEEQSVIVKKPEREKNRRKSTVNIRKNIDDDFSFPDCHSPEEISTKVKEEPIEDTPEDSKTVPLIKEDIPEPGTFDPKSIFDIKSLSLETTKNLLTWEGIIGILPGSKVKFTVNEFNLLEYVSDDECNKTIDKKTLKMKIKEDMEEVQCVVCDCYGIRADFISSQICSLDCQEARKSCPVKKTFENNYGFKKTGLKRKFGKTKTEIEVKDVGDGSVEDENSNDTSQDKFLYPWACKKKGFSWSKYLMYVNAKPAPVKLFKDPFPYTRNGFKPGMKLEGIDPMHPSYFCVLTVVDTMGYRIRLHFDGYAENYDFWVNADSLDIFPVGWCEKNNHVLRPPYGYTAKSFNWIQYLKATKSTSAPKQLFYNRSGQAICPNGFRIGMKLEAVDKKNLGLICVATVRDMMDNRILVHFDAWDDIYDYWADPTSPYIHPVGWCDQYGHNLTAPSDYPQPKNFNWDVYLKENQSIPAPARAFKQRPPCGFKRGMRLECVDKRVPHLIRVATVDDVKEHQIRISFDGWPDRYSYWVDDDSPDIHPIGWCQKTNHPLEPPLTSDDVYDRLMCETVGCKGQGHMGGPKYRRHDTVKDCPYAESNIDLERVLPDRLLSSDSSPESKEPISRQPKDYKSRPRLGRPPKWRKELQTVKSEEIIETVVPEEQVPERKRKLSPPKSDKTNKKMKLMQRSIEEKARLFILQSKIAPAERESWEKHSKFLTEVMDTRSNIEKWTVHEVADFIRCIPGCDDNLDSFKEHEIDGVSLLQLTQSDLIKLLKLKVGPAVKLYNAILLLRRQL